MKPLSIILMLLSSSLTFGEVRLKFQDNSTNETRWELERAEIGGEFQLVKTWASTTEREKTVRVEVVDETAEPGVDYRYRVQGVNPFGASGYSNVHTANSDDTSPPNGEPSYLSEQEKDTL